MLSRCCHSLSAKSAHHRHSNSSKLWFPLVHFSPGCSWIRVTRTHRSCALALNMVGKGKALGGKEPGRGGRSGADDLLRSPAGCLGPRRSGTEGWRAGKRGDLRWPHSRRGRPSIHVPGSLIRQPGDAAPATCDIVTLPPLPP